MRHLLSGDEQRRRGGPIPLVTGDEFINFLIKACSGFTTLCPASRGLTEAGRDVEQRAGRLRGIVAAIEATTEATSFSGVRGAARLQPKAAAAYTFSDRLPVTVYFNYGRGINNQDARGVVQQPEGHHYRLLPGERRLLPHRPLQRAGETLRRWRRRAALLARAVDEEFVTDLRVQ